MAPFERVHAQNTLRDGSQQAEPLPVHLEASRAGCMENA